MAQQVNIQSYPHVLKWLQQKYNSQIPFFEVNSETMEILSDLVLKSTSRTDITKNITIDYQEKVRFSNQTILLTGLT